jgi:hypothetical protein
MRDRLKSLVSRPRVLWSYVSLRTSFQVLRFLQYFRNNVLRMKYVSNYLSIHKL